MQNPVGAGFNLETMRMEMTRFGQLFFNPVAQVQFIHTVAGGYTTVAIFVLFISACYMLNDRDLPFARCLCDSGCLTVSVYPALEQ